ncbi:MAG: hypothetical protein ACI9XO_003431 [Paraglaciecola sp.]|jgi:uncharacterized protein YbaP (TraB family)
MKLKDKTLLWQISRPDQSQPSYVFGTMHVRDNAAFHHVNFIESIIQNCAAFATEYNLDEGQSNIPADMIYLPDGKSLTDFIPQKKYEKLHKAILKSFKIDLNPFKKLQPLFINNLIGEQLLSKDQDQALDSYLWNFAKDENKTLLGIETWKEQLKTLENLTLEYQIKSLIDIGKNTKKYRQAIQKSVRDYGSGDFQKLFQSAKKGSGDKRKILLYNRNKIMANRIAEFTEQHTIFAAIGAGHLGGKKGVLRLLKQQGFILKPIKMPH